MRTAPIARYSRDRGQPHLYRRSAACGELELRNVQMVGASLDRPKLTDRLAMSFGGIVLAKLPECRAANFR